MSSHDDRHRTPAPELRIDAGLYLKPYHGLKEEPKVLHAAVAAQSDEGFVRGLIGDGPAPGHLEFFVWGLRWTPGHWAHRAHLDEIEIQWASIQGADLLPSRAGGPPGVSADLLRIDAQEGEIDFHIDPVCREGLAAVLREHLESQP